MNNSLSHSTIIQEKLDLLPHRPGVYLFKNPRQEFIYIGKAVDLYQRVRSYFNEKAQSNHLASQILRDAAYDLEWIVTDNEVEALILEANLVNKHSPRYNILLKDDKHFPYIKVTLSEMYPRLEITRQVKKDKDLYFGPYTNVRAMRKTISLINKIFRIRDCDLKFPLDKPIRPCLSYHLKRCDAPCAFAVETQEYDKLVDEAILLLKGRHRDLTQRLKTNMREAASEEKFEIAAKLRNQLRDIEIIQEEQKMDLGVDDAPKDLIAVARMGRIGYVVILEIRDGFMCGRKQFEVNCPLDQDESEIITNFIKRYYLERNQGEIPRELILSHACMEEEHMEPLLREIRKAAVDLEVPQKGEKRRQILLAVENAKMQVMEAVAHRERRNRQDYRVTALQEDLQMKNPPARIEGYDISHLSGTDTVASQVVFIDGKPAKKEYRHYNVKTVEGIDDFASMKEILTRRVKRLVEEQKPFPDLILIDGGKGQLGMAYAVLKEYGHADQPIIGLAKRLEEIFFPENSEPLLIPKTSPSLQLLQQVRDEAHRFAITFQRSKRKKHHTESWLDEVDGIGEKTKMKLLRHFKSPAKIKTANEEELAAAAGKSIAEKIRSYLT